MAYLVLRDDQVVSLEGIPLPDIGAPQPCYYCGDSGGVTVVYFARGREMQRQWTACVTFNTDTFLIEPSNDEALSGHPLYNRGLRSHLPQEVVQSSWLRELQDRNEACFPPRTPGSWSWRHVVIAFKEHLFQVAAESWRVEESLTTPKETIAALLR